MRRYEIDWIRNISILMLFVYHTCAIFCQFGDFYIISEEKNLFADIIILLLFTWYMPMLFFLAGASTYFSFERRNMKEYIVERIKKLLVPLLFGLIFLVPPQTYLARVWRGEVNLNYFSHLSFFFSNVTDFTGFDGAFTPAHLWFILYLFVVSVLGGIILSLVFKQEKGIKMVHFLKKAFINKFSFLFLLLLGICSDLFPSIMGKSIIGCLLIFLLGYIVYEDDTLLEKLISHRFKYLVTLVFFAICGVIYTLLIRPEDGNITVWIIDSILKNGVLICAICTIIGFSSVHLNKNNTLLKFLNKRTFPIYIIHQPILLVLAILIVPTVESTALSIGLIIIFSGILTFIIYEILYRVKIFNFVLGMK
ncbi:acyltransferase family protein [Terrisporobacter glycolicus]|uniref:Glucans biosynthesis protein C n=1 Tax=Terrisporobacter glycolicus ATCC 14880 = DSM 1288 TaxID=1121315 RepID=A0ABZ2EVY7_9FIRM|nr:acyltransferase family protein [Terrisporobacter glycolicus]